jgi:small subunit ribosomal protein S3Ae|tara:strand:- start:1777 stop:2355 length:579 start_codon:yes stop_codon:yes gene_type:complete
MVKSKSKKIDTWKTKKWYEVFTPSMFDNTKICDTLASNSTNLIGRVVEATLRDLMGDFSKQHIKLEFQIDKVEGDKAYTKFKSQSLSRDYMRSQIRRKTTRVEGITDVITKDGHNLRVKTIALAQGRAQTAQEKDIRKIMLNKVIESAKNAPLDIFIKNVVMGKISTDMYKSSNKIYPLKRVEIRKVIKIGS